MTISLLTIVAGLLVAFVAFVFLRELWCWYFKFSEQVQLLKSIAASVAALEERTRNGAPAPALPRSGFDPPVRNRLGAAPVGAPVEIPASMRRGPAAGAITG